MTAVLPDIDLEKLFEESIPCETPNMECPNEAVWLITHKGAQPSCTTMVCEEHCSYHRKFISDQVKAHGKHSHFKGFKCIRCKKDDIAESEIVYRRL